MYNSKLYGPLYYFSFYNYWICFHFCFFSLVGIPVGITSSAIRLKVCEIAAGSKKYKSIIKKKKKRHDKIALLAKFKLNSIEVLMTKALTILLISHDESVLINKVHQRLYSI